MTSSSANPASACHPFLTVPASPDQLTIVRAAVRSLAAPYMISDDERCDLVLAVDEAAGVLIDHTTPSSTLDCALYTGADCLRFVVSTTTPSPVNACSFSWYVMEAAVDSLVLRQHPADGQWVATIAATIRLHARS